MPSRVPFSLIKHVEIRGKNEEETEIFTMSFKAMSFAIIAAVERRTPSYVFARQVSEQETELQVTEQS